MDHSSLDSARTELHDLINKPGLQGIPLLVLGNKNDLPGALTVDQVIEKMQVVSQNNPPFEREVQFARTDRLMRGKSLSFLNFLNGGVAGTSSR